MRPPAVKGNQDHVRLFLAPHLGPIPLNQLTRRQHSLVIASGLPLIRLRDLRHGAATLALAVGDDLRAVQGLLGHTSIVVTADIYTSVLPQLYHDSARQSAQLVMSAARKPARTA